MLVRLSVNLDREERIALDRLALKEMRDPRDQIRFILRSELKRQGLLMNSEDKNKERQDNKECQGESK
jgi:hypothetical protein